MKKQNKKKEEKLKEAKKKKVEVSADIIIENPAEGNQEQPIYQTEHDKEIAFGGIGEPLPIETPVEEVAEPIEEHSIGTDVKQNDFTETLKILNELTNTHQLTLEQSQKLQFKYGARIYDTDLEGTADEVAKKIAERTGDEVEEVRKLID